MSCVNHLPFPGQRLYFIFHIRSGSFFNLIAPLNLWGFRHSSKGCVLLCYRQHCSCCAPSFFLCHLHCHADEHSVKQAPGIFHSCWRRQMLLADTREACAVVTDLPFLAINKNKLFFFKKSAPWIYLLFQRLCSWWKANGVSQEVDGRSYAGLRPGLSLVLCACQGLRSACETWAASIPWISAVLRWLLPLACASSAAVSSLSSSSGLCAWQSSPAQGPPLPLHGLVLCP